MDVILYLIKGLGRGGAEQLLASAGPHLNHSRFKYEVAYLLPEKDALVDELEAAGVTVHCLDGARGLGWTLRLRQLVRERHVRLVHIHSPYTAIWARPALESLGVRRVYTEHNVWQRYHRGTYWGNLVTLPLSDHIFAVSDHVQSSIVYPGALRFLRMPPVETLYHGIDPGSVSTWAEDGVRAEFGLEPGVPLIGTVANFKTHKGYEYLLRAARIVRAQAPNARFVLVGQGPLLEPMKERARGLGLGDSVIFTGFRDDATRIAASLDVFVLSSLHEGLSIALIEAMALGRPCVVTDVGGLSEVVTSGEQGFLVPAADPRQLAAAIVRLIGDPELRERFGRAAERRAQEFDIRNAVRRMEEVYEELLA